jgi:hypothetical protein
MWIGPLLAGNPRLITQAAGSSILSSQAIGGRPFRASPEWRSRASRTASPSTITVPGRRKDTIDHDPPGPAAKGEEYVVLVPAVNADGNEGAGISMPLVRFQLGTYTGWSIRAPGQSPGALAGLEGSTIPFPASQAEREATGDPRPSLEERYPVPGDHARLIADAARRLIEEGFLLEEDNDRIVHLSNLGTADTVEEEGTAFTRF